MNITLSGTGNHMVDRGEYEPDTTKQDYCEECNAREGLVVHRYPAQPAACMRVQLFCAAHSNDDLIWAVKDYEYTARKVGNEIVFTKNEESK